MRARFSLLLLTAIAAGCATAKPDVPAATLAREEIVNGFRVAVVDVCVASALSGAPVAELATDEGPIVAATGAALAQAKPGETVWTSRQAEGVLIKTSQSECRVSASGASMRAALDATSEALSDPHGFVPETAGGRSGDVRRYSKKVGDRTFRVTLEGPGAQTASGTLVAVVTATPPA
jgi:hypothetical protein